MTITITEKEYIAISAVLDQVCTDYEAASNEEYLKSMGENIKLVNDVIKKYRAARVKANEFQSVRAYVSKRNRNLRPRDIDKLTRKVMKKMREEDAK